MASSKDMNGSFRSFLEKLMEFSSPSFGATPANFTKESSSGSFTILIYSGSMSS